MSLVSLHFQPLEFFERGSSVSSVTAFSSLYFFREGVVSPMSPDFQPVDFFEGGSSGSSDEIDEIQYRYPIDDIRVNTAG